MAKIEALSPLLVGSDIRPAGAVFEVSDDKIPRGLLLLLAEGRHARLVLEEPDEPSVEAPKAKPKAPKAKP